MKQPSVLEFIPKNKQTSQMIYFSVFYCGLESRLNSDESLLNEDIFELAMIKNYDSIVHVPEKFRTLKVLKAACFFRNYFFTLHKSIRDKPFDKSSKGSFDYFYGPTEFPLDVNFPKIDKIFIGLETDLQDSIKNFLRSFNYGKKKIKQHCEKYHEILTIKPLI
jgi:hypothetical protein